MRSGKFFFSSPVVETQQLEAWLNGLSTLSTRNGRFDFTERLAGTYQPAYATIFFSHNKIVLAGLFVGFNNSRTVSTS